MRLNTWITVAFFILFGVLLFAKCENPSQRPNESHIAVNKAKVDTLIIKVTEVQDRVIPAKRIVLRDTVQVLQQILTRDTVILYQDSIIRIQDTIIKQVEAVDALKSDSIVSLKKEIKRERFWKRVFRVMVPAAFVIGKSL